MTKSHIVSADKNKGQDFPIVLIDLTRMIKLGFLKSGSQAATLQSRPRVAQYIVGNYVTMHKLIKQPQNTPIAKAFNIYYEEHPIVETLPYVDEESLHKGLYLAGITTPEENAMPETAYEEPT